MTFSINSYKNVKNMKTEHTVLLGLYSSNISSGLSVPPSVRNMIILLQPATRSE